MTDAVTEPAAGDPTPAPALPATNPLVEFSGSPGVPAFLPALPIRGPGGGGGGGGGSGRPRVTASLDAMADVSGAEPGVPFVVSGHLTGPIRSTSGVSVTVGRVTYRTSWNFPPPSGATGINWSVAVRAYEAGNVPVTATAVVTTSDVDAAESRVPVKVTLTNSTPQFTVVHPNPDPAAHESQPLGAVGTTSYTCQFAMSDQFGPRTITASWPGQPTTPVVPPVVSANPQGAVELVPALIGDIPITFSCSCVEDPQIPPTQHNAVLIGDDVTSPVLTAPDAVSAIADEATNRAAVDVSGTAADGQSGMGGASAGVFWSLDPAAAGTAARTTTGWATWSIDVDLDVGVHQLYVWALDAAGNTTSKHLVTVTVESDYVAPDLDARLDDRECLAALVDFVAHSVNAGGAAIGTPQLTGVLGQEFGRLSQPSEATVAAGAAPVNELRVPVELIRRYLTATPVAVTAEGAAAEAAYREAAYDALLTGVGTSAVEIRLAASATDDERSALAARIGVAVDRLPGLTLTGDELTEAALERLFGLPATDAADPLRAVTPQLLLWQQAGQLTSWGTDDAPTSPVRPLPVLVDPDVIGDADIVSSPAGDPVRARRDDRLAALSTFAAGLTSARTGRSAADAWTAMLALTGWIDLDSLAGDEAAGHDLTDALGKAGLTRAGYLRLRQLQRLSGLQAAADGDWADAEAILTRAHSRHDLYPTWQTEETGQVLDPTVFAPHGPPATNPYRAEVALRATWTGVVQARTVQRQALADGLGAAVARTEQLTLPMLRDALLSNVHAGGDPDPIATLTGRFELDMGVGGTQTSTRVEQAITALTSLLLDLRSGELRADHPAASWKIIDQVVFDQRWARLGTPDTWRSAAVVYLFAEQYLDPSLLPTRTNDTAFPGLLSAATDLTMTFDAGSAADAYLQKLVDPAVNVKTYIDQSRLEEDLHTYLAGYSLDLASGGEEAAAQEIFWAAPLVIARRLQSDGRYREALDWFSVVLPARLPEVKSSFHVINNEWTEAAETLTADLTFPPNWTDDLNPFHIVQPRTSADPPDFSCIRPAPFLRFTAMASARCHLDFGDAEFVRDTDLSRGHARELYLTALRLLSLPQLDPLTPPKGTIQSTLELPERRALLTRARGQLAKLRQGRNIAGQPRTSAGVLSSGTTNGTNVQPTPYHFKTLLDRARQLTAAAQQVEAGYLAALEKFDAKTLELSDAQDAANVAAAQLTLAQDKVTEATDAVAVAVAQQTKADTMTRRYQALVDSPPNHYESSLLREYGQLRDIQNGIAGADLVIGVAQGIAAAANVGSAISSGGISVGAGVAEAAGAVVKGVLTAQANEVQAQIQANQLRDGIEQRRAEWRTALVGNQQDGKIAAAQVTVAVDQKTIATQEQNVALLGQQHAQARLATLQNELTGPDLYSWLADNLGGVYRYFLGQATATARLAQNQLAFERAEAARTIIGADYTQMPAELVKRAGGTSPGLAGAELLAADVDRLDQYAFSTTTRRLNISQTFSLAQLMPTEFLELRRTGTTAFTTQRALFDADFPGHYLRLISGVSVSLVALIPPNRGVRATLASTGVSRVTRQADGVFEDIVLRHDPGLIALTSPLSATGVFTLDAQPELLRPFEGQGVDTSWELKLPPAANPFDFGTIADVLLTLDYTALFDDGYYTEVTTDLNAHRTRGSDCVFSLARDLPDQWYDLNNPGQDAPRTATVTLRAQDFPLSVTNLTTTQVTVHLESTAPVPPTSVTLQRTVAVNGGTVTTTLGGAATTADGTAGTRRGATTWGPLCVGSPSGDWQLSFNADAEPLFTGGALRDVTLMIGWSGQGPAWS